MEFRFASAYTEGYALNSMLHPNGAQAKRNVSMASISVFYVGRLAERDREFTIGCLNKDLHLRFTER